MPSTINFSIGEGEYEAEEGMTFGEWVESEYNTDGYILDNTTVKVTIEETTYSVEYDGAGVVGTDAIVDDRAYDLTPEV